MEKRKCDECGELSQFVFMSYEIKTKRQKRKCTTQMKIS